MEKKIIVFDFDGTIADTLEAVVRVANRLAQKFGFKKIGKRDVNKLRDKTPLQILKEFQVPLFKVTLLIKTGRMELSREMKNLKAINGMRVMLQNLKRKGYRLGIVTSNSEENVNIFLKYNRLNFFDFVYGDIGIFGKKRMLKTLLKKYHLKSTEIIYVGDEVRDIEAAQKSNVVVVSVSWGFNTRQILASHHPDFLIDRPSELVSVLTSFY